MGQATVAAGLMVILGVAGCVTTPADEVLRDRRARMGTAFEIQVRSPSGTDARAAGISEATEEAFDVTFAACGRLWSFRDPVRVPIESEHSDRRTQVGWKRIELDPYTGLLVLGSERGMALVERLPDVEALFLVEDRERSRSSGFPPVRPAASQQGG